MLNIKKYAFTNSCQIIAKIWKIWTFNPVVYKISAFKSEICKICKDML